MTCTTVTEPRVDVHLQLLETVLRSGTPVILHCEICGRQTEHRDKRIGNAVHTVCRACRTMTTSA
ncbi:MAG TPA: hypothetical protein PK954_19380 [Anaerolineales bacterium]|nr:hypothetical protein [Anaerolineales bacterium]